jgi:Double zinc ribbon
MKCPSCGCENREGAKFCGDCAAPLTAALACPSCGTANPKGRKFCDSCGQPLAEPSAPDPRSYTPKHLAEKILTSRGALEGERKQVTVLFADVKGSMDLAETGRPRRADWADSMLFASSATHYSYALDGGRRER